MGFLKLKKVGKYRYFYWCERKRAKKRQGASGRVKSIDLCLGTYVDSERLAFYCWAGDIPIEEYITQALPYLVSPGFASRVDFSFTLEPKPVLKLRAKPGGGIDLRHREWAPLKEQANRNFANLCNWAFEHVNTYLEFARESLSMVKEAEQKIAELEADLKTYRADPGKTWDHRYVWENRSTGEEIDDQDFDPSSYDLEKWTCYKEWSRYPEDYEEVRQGFIDRWSESALQGRNDCKRQVEEIVKLAPKDRQKEARERLLRELRLS
ncbi:MAG: hypothetical protein ACKO24_11280 [Leptolyngbyaceae cyanobacterium]